MGVLDEVRAAAAATAATASCVEIRHDAIAAYAASLPLDRLQSPELDPNTHFIGEPEATLAFVVQLDAINFGSGYFPGLTKRLGMSGYFTVASSLKDLFEVEGPPTAAQLQRLTREDLARICGQPEGNAEALELMALFARALTDLGRFAAERFGGSFTALVAEADGSAERLVGILSEMPFYQDVGFYKRAQLTAADLSIARAADFADLSKLTIFADNLVPHVLRVDGILRYEDGLVARIQREELIPAGSREEREIRACALHAVELIADALGRRVWPMQLDYLLWNRGQQPAYKAIPRHRTRTVFY
jgi:Potential Queuosine, Q, salvage protein family